MADPSRSSYAPHSPNLSHYPHSAGDSVHERYRYHPYQRQQSQQQHQQQPYYHQYPGQYQPQSYQQPQIASYTQQQQQQQPQSRQNHQQDEQQMQFQKYYPPEQQSSQACPVPAPAPAPEPQTRYHSSTMPLYPQHPQHPQPTKNQPPHQAPAFPSTYQATAGSGSGPGSSYSSQVPSYTSNFAIPQNSATASYSSPSVAAPASPTSTYNRNHGPPPHQVAGQGTHLNSHPHPHSHSHSQPQPQPQPQPQAQPKPQAHPHSYQQSLSQQHQNQPQFHHQAPSSPTYDSSLQPPYTQQLQSQPRQLAGASSHSHPKPEDCQSASHAIHVPQQTTVPPIKVEERSPKSISSAQMPPRRAAAAAAAAAIKNDEDTEEEILTLPEPLHDAPIEPSPVKTKFPTARIKRIMQADEEVGKVAQQAPIAVGKALELFMVALVSKSADVARERGQKRITTAMMKQVIETDDQWDFLRDISAKVDTEEKPSRAGRAPKQEASDTEDENPEPKKEAVAVKRRLSDLGSLR